MGCDRTLSVSEVSWTQEVGWARGRSGFGHHAPFLFFVPSADTGTGQGTEDGGSDGSSAI